MFFGERCKLSSPAEYTIPVRGRSGGLSGRRTCRATCHRESRICEDVVGSSVRWKQGVIQHVASPIAKLRQGCMRPPKQGTSISSPAKRYHAPESAYNRVGALARLLSPRDDSRAAVLAVRGPRCARHRRRPLPLHPATTTSSATPAHVPRPAAACRQARVRPRPILRTSPLVRIPPHL